MTYFAANLLLAMIWAALTGLALGNLLLGFVIGFLVLALSRPFLPSAPYVRAVLAIVSLSAVFLGELIKANVRLAVDVLRRRPRFDPAVLRIDSSDLGGGQAALLAALISLTPGSVAVDVTEGGEAVFVHTVYAHDIEAARRSIDRFAGLIRRMAAVSRGEGGPP